MNNVENESAMRIKTMIHDTEEIRKALNDVNNWAKEVKDLKEKLYRDLDEVEDDEYTVAQPIRSHALKDKPLVLRRDNETNNKSKRKIEIEEKQLSREDKAEIFKTRGNNHVKLGDHERAILEYTAAIDAYDEDPKYFTNRALCYLKLNKYNECIDDCNKAIELDKLNVKAYYRRMLANESLCHYTQALRDCTSVLMIDSKNLEAKESLQRLNQRLKKTGTAQKGYQQPKPVIKEGPQFSPLRSNMMDIHPATKLPSSISKKPLKTIPIIDVIGPKDGKNYENSNVQISDEVIDKLFNGECGAYEEIKKTDVIKAKAPLEKESNKVLKQKSVSKTTKGSGIQPAISLEVKRKPLPSAPTTPAQFYCNWKELSSEQKYLYLKSIPGQRLNKILGASLDSDTLTEILSIFKEFYVGNNDDNLCETLLQFCKNDRLKILTLMLSPEDKDALTDVLNYIKKKTSEESLDIIKKSFNFV